MSLTISKEDCKQDGLLERKMIGTGFRKTTGDRYLPECLLRLKP